MNLEVIISIIADTLGIVLAIAFVVLMFRGRRSLQGSFFPHYYRAMTIASVALLFGFVIEPIGMYVLPLDEFLIESLHHFGLIVASILFVYSSYVLPKDATKYIKGGEVPSV